MLSDPENIAPDACLDKKYHEGNRTEPQNVSTHLIY